MEEVRTFCDGAYSSSRAVTYRFHIPYTPVIQYIYIPVLALYIGRDIGENLTT